MDFNFKRLKIWSKAHQLTLLLYKLTEQFPKHELYGITSQIRRSISSVPANIVEGYSRKGTKEFIHFLYQARASLDESIYFMFLAKDLNYISSSKFSKFKKDALVLVKMLNSFISKLNAKNQ